MATWYTLYTTSSGVCRGHTSIQPVTPDPSMTVRADAQRMDQAFLWNTVTRAWDIPRPVPVLVDRLQDIANHPFAAELWSRLTAAQRIKLRQLLVWLLASKRFRQQLETVALDADDAWPTDPSLVPPP
jgi:hypothetical protein